MLIQFSVLLLFSLVFTKCTLTNDTIRTCRMDVEAGDCQESLQRYYYSPRSGYCYLFKYTGCKGNENNFEYREQCQAKCQGVTACPVYDISNSPGCQMTLIGDDEKLCPIFNVTCPSRK